MIRHIDKLNHLLHHKLMYLQKWDTEILQNKKNITQNIT